MSLERIHEDFRLDGRKFHDPGELLRYLDQRSPEASALIRAWLDPKGRIEVRTSGSTGRPKTIVIEGERMRQSALATGEFFELGPGSKALLCLPLKYIAGKMMLVRALVLGWHLTIVDPVVRLNLQGLGDFDFAAMIPMQVEANLEELGSIKTLIVGGAPVHRELQDRILDLPTRIYATYGMTETITHIALMPLNRSAGREEDREVFRGLPGVSFETDERGCLVIHCKRISEDPIVTNDLVHCLTRDSFTWRGRLDGIINSGGLKLVPEEIERKFSPCVKGRFFAAGLPDEKLGQRLVLVIEGPKDPGLEECLRRLQKDPEGSVSKHELPGRFFFLESFAETGSGKIDRSKTLELLGSPGTL